MFFSQTKQLLWAFAALLLFSQCAEQQRDGASHEGGRNTMPVTEAREEATQTASDAKAKRMEPKPAEPMPDDSDDPIDPEMNTEDYDHIKDNPFLSAKKNPLSTFSIDVDKASYANVRRYIEQMNDLPPAGAVRIEEMINYFNYDYPQPTGQHPFSITTEVATAPWNKAHQLVHIGLQGKKLNYDEVKPSNLVFLIDASGSMNNSNKLPLLKRSLKLLLNELGDEDRIAIVAYAGAAGEILPSTPATQKQRILDALDEVEAGGSTAGGAGIELAYKIAQENSIPDGNNRIILATDGDFNVGPSSRSSLINMIIEKRQRHDIYLTICGFGMGNYKDGSMEAISNAGNGNYFYIDNIREAEKVFVRDMRANMFTLAKDVKIQVEFNPALVKGYRLIGYENRVMPNEDFNDDTKDAGELGAGHTVTALYEIIPVGSSSTQKIGETDELKYQQNEISSSAMQSSELMTVKFRYKPLKSDKSILMTEPLKKQQQDWENSSENFRFSAAVAGFGMLLRDSPYKAETTFSLVQQMAKGAMGDDPDSERLEFLQLVKSAEALNMTAER